LELKNFKDSIIIITGGAGFVGSNLTTRLLDFDVKKIVIVDNLLSAEPINIPDSNKIQFILGSITDDKVLSQLPKETDYVFHLVTYHGNQSSIVDPIADHENNTFSTLKLLESIKNFKNLKAVVYSSAGCTIAKKTYDDVEATKEDATVSLYLDSPYQISKIIGEFYGNYYFMKHNVPFIKARFQNVYGPGEILGAGRWRGTQATIWRNVVPTFIWKAINKEPLPVENGGMATRDFIYVSDIVEGLVKCALLGRPGGIYNLASGIEISIKETAELINKLTGNPANIELKPARNWDRSGKRYGDTSKSFNEINFKTEIDFEDGLKKTVEWTKSNYEIIQQCINKQKILMEKLFNET